MGGSALPADDGGVAPAPLPPSLSTVTQLGLGGARGVPSLLAAALGDGVPAAVRDWFRLLLLLPPPPTAAEDIRVVCGHLAAPGPGAPALPVMVTSIAGPRIIALLQTGVAGHNTLREMHGRASGGGEARRWGWDRRHRRRRSRSPVWAPSCPHLLCATATVMPAPQ